MKKEHGFAMMAASGGGPPIKKGSGSAYPAVGSPLHQAAIAAAKRAVEEEVTGPVQTPPGPPPGPPTDAPAVIVPVPVALNWSTILKLVGPTIAFLLFAISFGIYFVHQANQHVGDDRLHLSPKNGVGWGISKKHETRVEAQAARNKIAASVKREIKTSIREIKVDQTAAIQKLSGDLKRDQRKLVGELKRAVRKARTNP